MGDLFTRERELCTLLMKNRRNECVSIDYSISNKSVDVLVYYKNKANWNIKSGESGLNRLWRNFNLAYIGYKTECLTLNYSDGRGFHVTEHVFPMKYFNIVNFHSEEFKKYDPSY